MSLRPQVPEEFPACRATRLTATQCSSAFNRRSLAIQTCKQANSKAQSQASWRAGMQTTSTSTEGRAAKRLKLDDTHAAKPSAAKASSPIRLTQKQKPKKQRPMTPELQLMMDVQSAAKTQQASIGVAAYKKAIAEGTRINPDLYSNLLYLCAGCDDWELPLRQQLIEATPLTQNIMHMAASSDATDTPELNDAPQEASNGAAPSPQSGAAPPPSQCNNLDIQAAKAGVDQEAGTAVVCAEATATTSADAAASVSASQSGRGISAAGGEEVASTAGRDVPSMSAAELHAAGRSIFAHMQGQKVKALELAYTALARMAAANGDGDAAVKAAEEGLRAGVPARLRTFVPALLAYAVAGDVDKAFQVAERVQEQKLDMTELEFGLLLQACARGGASWKQVQALLKRMARELTRLQPETLAAAEQYFRSDAAAKEFQPSGALAGKGKAWLVEPCTVSGSGQTSNCGGQLEALDLEDDEWEQFTEGIANLAAQRERKPKDFETFKAWLAEHGPVHVLVDGANVALYGQNWEHGGFSFGQIQGVMNELAKAHPGLHPLMLLHAGRVKGGAADSKPGKTLLADLRSRHSFYATPFGSNDDWYWMYAAAKAGPEGLLVSNDEMRDHLFQLLAPRFFHKWKQRHQVRFSFGEAGLQLHYPAIYTVCTQMLANGSCVFPAPSGNAWLSARIV